MSLMDILAWSAAEDAAGASRAAEEEARLAREETQRHTSLLQSQEHQEKVHNLNKMFQDLFYDREVENYYIEDMKKLVQRYDIRRMHRAFPKHYRSLNVPYIAIPFMILTAYILYKAFVINLFTVAVFIVLLFTFLSVVADIKLWIHEVRYKKYYKEKREEDIERTYKNVMQSLAKEFFMLTGSGLVVRFEIDNYIKETYKALHRQNPQRANSALLSLYYLLFNISGPFTQEAELILVRVFLQREELQNLINSKKLLTYESLQIFENKEYD